MATTRHLISDSDGVRRYEVRNAAGAVIGYDTETDAPAGAAPSVEDRLAAVEAEVRGMRERAAAAAVTDPDAVRVRDAVAGKETTA